MPPVITAGTGMDALAHCLEAYCAPFYHPMADGIALEGMRLVQGIPAAAVKDGNDIEARAHMMARRGDGRHRLPEGARRHPFAVASGRRALRHAPRHDQRRLHALCARLQPRRRSRTKIERLAAYLGIAGGFDGFVEAVVALRNEIGIPHTLAGLNVGDAKFEQMAEMAVVDPTAGSNPVKLTKEAALQLFQKALSGEVEPAGSARRRIGKVARRPAVAGHLRAGRGRGGARRRSRPALCSADAARPLVRHRPDRRGRDQRRASRGLQEIRSQRRRHLRPPHRTRRGASRCPLSERPHHRQARGRDRAARYRGARPYRARRRSPRADAPWPCGRTSRPVAEAVRARPPNRAGAGGVGGGRKGCSLRSTRTDAGRRIYPGCAKRFPPG